MTAQIMKIIIPSIKNRKWVLDRFLGDGGMPSTHSAVACALAMTSWLCFGFTSIQFAITVVFAVMVMHDACGVRRESGKQAKAINDLHDHLQSLLKMPGKERLEEFLGHTLFQVVMGAATGILVALIVHLLL